MYKILAATRDDMNEGWVWFSKHTFLPRSIVKIENNSNNFVIYCEALKIDANFLREYNQKPRIHIDENEQTIIMNDWYRQHLGNISTQKSYDLKVSEANGPYGKFRVCIGHPQVIVRLAAWLALISVGLGIISIGLAVWI
ncbi:MAG: hypothetical protein P8Y43_07065 [Sulfurovaceae bacterium]